MNTSELEIYPLGETCLIVRFARSMSYEAHHEVKALCKFFERRAACGIVECVPSFASLAVVYDLCAMQKHLMQSQSRVAPFDYVEKLVRQGLENTGEAASETSREIVIPVSYGGAHGRDLEAVAAHCRVSTDEVVALHAKGSYQVLFNGFAPGFVYLAGLAHTLSTPRLSTPRVRVPTGSIGIGNTQTGIYSSATPGGWNLIGRTPRTLFDMRRTPPGFLRPGDKVKFQAISPAEFGLYAEPV